MSLNQDFQPQSTLENFIEENLIDTLDEFKKNISQMPQDKLCEIIVCFRYLGLMQEEAVLAMEELALRREKGENFDYEARINELSADLPEIHIDINKILKSFRI